MAVFQFAGESETADEKGREMERAESRIPVKASVRQDILLAVVIVEMHVSGNKAWMGGGREGEERIAREE